MEMEDVGENYFDELLTRSLFQEPELDKYNNITHCKMHDLVHDLAQFVTKGEFLHVSKEKNIKVDAQYPPLHCTISNMEESPNNEIDVEKLRTFICTPYMSGIQIEEMRHLRVLELSHWSLEELPDVVGNYVHLRYLKMCMGKFKAIPGSIGKLQNLLYLDLSHTSIEALPESVGKLRNLKHLDLSWSKNLKALPSTIGRLTNLSKLDLQGSALDEIPDSIGKLGSLQVLDVSCCQNLEKLPESIKDLSRLQALNVSCCQNLEKLPESIKDLSRLQALNVSSCLKLKQLPAGIFDKMTGLKKLRVLCTGLRGLPAGIGKLTDLQRLEHFWVLGSHGGSSSSSSPSSSNICELRDLNHLRGDLRIHNLEMVTSGEEAASAQLHNKNSLTWLTLEWNTRKEETTSEDVLQALRPCPTLPKLWIEGYPGRTVPSWLWDSNTQELFLDRWDGCTDLPALGNLPELRQLDIQGMPKVRRVGAEWFGSGFPKLVSLGFWDMAEWEEWDILFFTFPCLIKLVVQYCPKLQSLPRIFSTSLLREIDVRGCPNLSNWLGILPPSIVTLSSISAEWVNEMPSLPNLQHLTISGDDGVSELSDHLVTKLGALKALYIEDCPNLESLPQEMASLTQLQRLGIWKCPKLEESCYKEGAQWYKIQHIPNIEIHSEEDQSSDDDE